MASTDLDEQVRAGDPGQPDIGDNRIESLFFQPAQRIQAAAGGRHFPVALERCQRASKRPRGICVVGYEEYSAGHFTYAPVLRGQHFSTKLSGKSHISAVRSLLDAIATSKQARADGLHGAALSRPF